MELLEKLLAEDAIYQKDINDAQRLKQMYEKFELTDEQRMLIDDYIACLDTAAYRKCEVALKLGKLLGEMLSET